MFEVGKIKINYSIEQNKITIRIVYNWLWKGFKFGESDIQQIQFDRLMSDTEILPLDVTQDSANSKCRF